MHLRDTLIERIARAIYAERWDTTEPDEGWDELSPRGRQLYLNQADAALSVVETATSTCPECGGRGTVSIGGGIAGDCVCGGKPEPLLVLQVLGWTPDGWTHEGASFTGRFPRHQEGTP